MKRIRVRWVGDRPLTVEGYGWIGEVEARLNEEFDRRMTDFVAFGSVVVTEDGKPADAALIAEIESRLMVRRESILNEIDLLQDLAYRLGSGDA